MLNQKVMNSKFPDFFWGSEKNIHHDDSVKDYGFENFPRKQIISKWIVWFANLFNADESSVTAYSFSGKFPLKVSTAYVIVNKTKKNKIKSSCNHRSAL